MSERGNREAELMRERLQALAEEAKKDPGSLAIADLEELCLLVLMLTPEG